MTTIDIIALEYVTGGQAAAAPAASAEPTPTKATYLNACGRGAVDGAIAGASSGAGMLPFAAMSGPLTPATIGTFVGVGAAAGGAIGCGAGMWDLYKARNPLEK